MKKIILFVLIVIIAVGSYYYYNGKTKEVILIGQVVGFEIENFNIEDYTNKNSKMVLTSSTAIGTITCMDIATNSFVALGHAISNNSNELELDGKCYKIYFDYVKKEQ